MTGVLEWLQSTDLSTGIRDSLYLFPLIEAFHVVGLATLFGTIAILDFRLLGLASARRPVTVVMSDIMKWASMAFVLTASTGALMFITNASTYYQNFFFRTKMVLLVLAGINVLLFELTSRRGIHRWDKDAAASGAAKTAAVLSLVLWVAIIFMGRWIGFTVRSQTQPAPEVNFEDLFAPSPGGEDAPK
jgi:hypothetical protein